MTFLPADLLDRIHSRAAQYDQDNAFPVKDYQELKAAGYYRAFVPKEYGGFGLSLHQIAQEQTRLAQAAPGTALGINMHQIIVGLGRHLVRQGDQRGETILRAAANDQLFGFGISEPGNDLVLFGSITKVEKTERGFSFTGTKVFTSLAPAWDQLATFGRWDSPDGPKSVFALLSRGTSGIEIKNDWDVIGMRATQSNTTILSGAEALADQVLGIVDPGPSMEPVVFGIFAYFEVLLAATYTGIGQRAIEVAAEHVKQRKSVKNQTVYANDPDIRWRLAQAAITMDALPAQLQVICEDLENGVDRGPIWLPQLSALKNRCAEASRESVEECIRACGGSSYYQKHELSRLYRDVLAGLFQPSDQESLHAAWANVVLGPVG